MKDTKLGRSGGAGTNTDLKGLMGGNTKKKKPCTQIGYSLKLSKFKRKNRDRSKKERQQ